MLLHNYVCVIMKIMFRSLISLYFQICIKNWFSWSWNIHDVLYNKYNVKNKVVMNRNKKLHVCYNAIFRHHTDCLSYLKWFANNTCQSGDFDGFQWNHQLRSTNRWWETAGSLSYLQINSTLFFIYIKFSLLIVITFQFESSI